MELMTPEEVAAVLRLSPYTVRKMLRNGELMGLRVGRWQWRVKREDLDAYIEKQTHEARDQEH